MTPTQRTLKLLRFQGFIAQVTEHWNGFARRRVDLFGFGDIVAMSAPGVSPQYNGLWLVQTTSGTNHSARRNKILQECRKEFERWTALGGRVVVVSWAKRAGRWQPRWEELSAVQKPGLVAMEI
jgi:hypothetical protein